MWKAEYYANLIICTFVKLDHCVFWFLENLEEYDILYSLILYVCIQVMLCKIYIANSFYVHIQIQIIFLSSSYQRKDIHVLATWLAPMAGLLSLQAHISECVTAPIYCNFPQMVIFITHFPILLSFSFLCARHFYAKASAFTGTIKHTFILFIQSSAAYASTISIWILCKSFMHVFHAFAVLFCFRWFRNQKLWTKVQV